MVLGKDLTHPPTDPPTLGQLSRKTTVTNCDHLSFMFPSPQRSYPRSISTTVERARERNAAQDESVDDAHAHASVHAAEDTGEQ